MKAKGPREVLGFTECHDCGAKVEVRVAQNGLLYYVCDTSVDAKGCNGRHWYGPRVVREMRAKAAADAPAPSDDVQDVKEGDNGVLAEETGDGESGDDNGGDGDGGLWFT